MRTFLVRTAGWLGVLFLWIVLSGNFSAVKSLVTTGALPTTTTTTTSTTITTTSTTITTTSTTTTVDDSPSWVLLPDNPCRDNPVTCADDERYWAQRQAESYYDDLLDWERECWSEELAGLREYMAEEGTLDEYCWDGHAGY